VIWGFGGGEANYAVQILYNNSKIPSIARYVIVRSFGVPPIL